MKLSIEKLYHFQCGTCDNWFSVGDLQLPATVTCPFCGSDSMDIGTGQKITEEVKE